MTVTLRIRQDLVAAMLADLRRPHEFAYERVGFMYCKQTALTSGCLLLAYAYEPIRDDQYIVDDTVGARFDSASIRHAMQFALQHEVAVFHVHLHEHAGPPRFSGTDTREMQALMPCFVNVQPDRVHGALILSTNSASASAWSTDVQEGTPVQKIAFVGPQMTLIGQSHETRPV
jgi:hypothetical protein